MNTTKTITLDSIESRAIEVKRGERVLLMGIFSVGSAERQKLIIRLSGEGASVDCIFVCVGTGTELFPFDIEIVHEQAHTHSAVAMRTVLSDEARVDSRGGIHILSQAGNSDTYFSHHALLLSEQTRAHILPSLEIEHNAVQAGHAVTVGRVDEEVLFYCASRGISVADAMQLVTRGFLLTDTKLIHDVEQKNLLEHNVDSILERVYARS